MDASVDDICVDDADEFGISDGKEVLAVRERLLHQVENSNFSRGYVLRLFLEFQEGFFGFSFYDVISVHIILFLYAKEQSDCYSLGERRNSHFHSNFGNCGHF